MLRIDQLFFDARFGLRQLVRSPLVATIAVLTLAIGIGLNIAVFCLVSGVARGDPESALVVAVRMVSPAYLRAMGVSLVRGAGLQQETHSTRSS